MSKKLFFRRLEIHRFPGFRPAEGFSLDGFIPEVNVIYGPNGSGKTTIARVLLSLLWPSSSPEVCHVNGNFELEDETWFVENENGSCTYSRNGTEIEGFSFDLPASDQSDRYYLALHNLLQKNIRDIDFARVIARETAGGYDFSAVEDELSFRSRPSNAGRPTDKRADRILKEIEELRKDINDLHEEERTLDRLKEELKEAKIAERKADFYDDLLEYRKRKEELKKLKRQLETFPDPVAKMAGNEKKRLEKIEEKIARIKTKKETSQEKIEKSSSILAHVNLPEEGVPTGLIKKLEEKTDRLEDREKVLEEIELEIVDRVRVKEDVHAGLSDEFSTAELKELDIVGIQDLAEFSREAEDVRTTLKVYHKLRKWLRVDKEPELNLQELREGKRYLEEWLRTTSLYTSGTSIRLINRTLGTLSLVGAAVFGLLIHPLFFVLLIPASGFAWLDRRYWDNRESRETNKRRYLELEIENPEKWNDGSVRKLHRKLSRLEASYLLDRKKEDFLSAKEEELSQLEERKAELKARKEELVDQYGVAPEIDEGKLHWLVERLTDWKSADEDLEGLTGKKEAIEKSISELRRELSEKLDSFGYENLKDSTDFRDALRDLKRRKERFSRAKDKLTDAKTRKEEANDQLEELKTEKKHLFEDLGLEVGNRGDLYRYSERKEDYNKIQSEVRQKEAVCKSKFKELKEKRDFNEELLNKQVPELKNEQRNLNKKAEKVENIFEKINRIEERVRGRKSKNELEMAQARLDRALNQLEDQLYSDYESMAGNVLLNYLREETFNRSRPQVFDRGGEIFTRVTKGEYRLVLAETDPPTFRAVDTESGETKSLNELSSGTRLQLLASVRMAFVEQQEKNVQLPLLLDEVLANSDDVKASEALDVALEFSRSGRQVFYFTAQGDEVARWRENLEESGDVSGNFVDLSKARGLAKTIEIPETTSIDSDNEPPDPEDMNHHEYGKVLGVQKFVPDKGAGSTHLWFLIEDVELLYRFLKLEITTWGRLKALVEENAKLLDEFDESELRRVKELGLVVERYVELWQIGRNSRIDRAVLEESGAVTENFMDEVVELVRDSNGKPEEVINRLDSGVVPGFRSDKKNELEDFLEKNDYIKNEDKLNREEIKTRLLSTFNPQDPENPGKTITRLLVRLTEF